VPCGPHFREVFSINMRIDYFIYCLIFISVSNKSFSQEHYVVFINGYRGIGLDHYTADGRIINPKEKFIVPADSSFKSDEWIIGYWKPNNLHFDDSILAHYKGAIPLYIDGHHPMSSSNYRIKSHLIWSFFKSKLLFFLRNPKGIILRKPNITGFNLRLENGKKIGKKLRNTYLIGNTSKITIVCHSMGFAVALGICKSIQGIVKFQDFLIFSPDGANIARFNWKEFQHVWHYSPSWKNKHYRLVCLQDGIAPQSPLFELNNDENYGIVGVPERSKKVKLGFFKSHHLSYYNWFFDIKKGERGYFGDY